MSELREERRDGQSDGFALSKIGRSTHSKNKSWISGLFFFNVDSWWHTANDITSCIWYDKYVQRHNLIFFTLFEYMVKPISESTLNHNPNSLNDIHIYQHLHACYNSASQVTEENAKHGLTALFSIRQAVKFPLNLIFRIKLQKVTFLERSMKKCTVWEKNYAQMHKYSETTSLGIRFTASTFHTTKVNTQHLFILSNKNFKPKVIIFKASS